MRLTAGNAETIPSVTGEMAPGTGNFHCPLLPIKHLFLPSLGGEVGGHYFLEKH